MTEEGIVQKVFKRYIGFRQLEQEPNVSFDKNDVLEFTIHIQQELIEAIKQEFIGSSAIYTYVVRRKLIGDSQE